VAAGNDANVTAIVLDGRVAAVYNRRTEHGSGGRDVVSTPTRRSSAAQSPVEATASPRQTARRASLSSASLIVSLLADGRCSDVARALPAGATHERVRGGASLIDALRRPECGHALVDPSLVTGVSLDSIVLAAATAAVPLVLIGDLSTRAIEACLFAQGVRPTNASFSDAVDCGWLRFVLDARADADVPALLLRHAGGAIARLPEPIRLPTAALFTGGSIAESAQALGRAAGLSGKTVQRWYARVGLACPPYVFAIARLARAWRLLHVRQLSIRRTASLTGFGSARTLSRACRLFAGCAPSRVRELPNGELARRLGTALLAAGAGPRGVPPS